MEDLKHIVNNMRDEDELEVGYERTWESVYDWLIRPVDKKGCGFDATFVDRLMPLVVNQIKRGELKFESGKAFDLYLRDRCREYDRRFNEEAAKLRQELFNNEFVYQHSVMKNYLEDLEEQNRNLRSGVTWLSIITVSSVMVTLLALGLAVRF